MKDGFLEGFLSKPGELAILLLLDIYALPLFTLPYSLLYGAVCLYVISRLCPLIHSACWHKKANLQLCDNREAGSVRCNERGGGCAGSNNGNCNPNVVWGGITSSGVPFTGHMNSGGLNLSTGYDRPWAFSVRCVQDLVPVWFQTCTTGKKLRNFVILVFDISQGWLPCGRKKRLFIICNHTFFIQTEYQAGTKQISSLQALCGAMNWVAAVRAPAGEIVSRTLPGAAVLLAADVFMPG